MYFAQPSFCIFEWCVKSWLMFGSNLLHLKAGIKIYMRTFGLINELQFSCMINIGSHTSQNSFYKWTKIWVLKLHTIFYLKMMVKSGLDFLFWNSPSPFRVADAQCKRITPLRLNWPGRLARISEGAQWISK